MGMFNTIVCNMDLPGGEALDPEEHWFQTKSICPNAMDAYTITKDGYLHKEGNLVRHTGDIYFYTLDSKGEWWEWKATFKDGKCVKLTKVSEGDW